MKTLGRSIRRWYLDLGPRLVDLAVLLLTVWGAGATLAFVDLHRIGLVPVQPDRQTRWIIWLVVVVVALAVYAWRRWSEIDALLTEADTDVLTGLNNRRKIERLLAHEFDRAARYGRPLAVIMIDIDRFKRINDTYGHAVGDVVLTTLARRVRRRMRTSDHFGRWGGEEFLLICPETPLEEATLVADRMRRTIKHRTMDKAGFVTASFGVSAYADHPNYDRLVDEADSLLYMAKRQGRDRVMNERLAQELALRRDSGRALADDEPGGTSLGAQLTMMAMTVMAPLRRKKRKP